MERQRKELLRLCAAFIFAITLGVLLSQWMLKSPLNPYVFENEAVPSESAPTQEEAVTEPSTPEEAPAPADTRPLKKQEFRKASRLAKRLKPKKFLPDHNRPRFTKADYDLEASADGTGIEDAENFFGTVYDTKELEEKQALSDAEKSFTANMAKMLEAQNHLQVEENSLADMNSFRVNYKEMQRFGLKFSFPEQNDPARLTFQYREAPDFGTGSRVPEPILPKVTPKASGFIGVEKSKTSESPWNNFDQRPSFGY